MRGCSTIGGGTGTLCNRIGSAVSAQANQAFQGISRVADQLLSVKDEALTCPSTGHRRSLHVCHKRSQIATTIRRIGIMRGAAQNGIDRRLCPLLIHCWIQAALRGKRGPALFAPASQSLRARSPSELEVTRGAAARTRSRWLRCFSQFAIILLLLLYPLLRQVIRAGHLNEESVKN